MKNEKLDAFLYKNRLKSSDLVEFWGVTKGVVSQILNGTTKLPTKRLEELLNNPYGWDVSMLTETQSRDEVARMADQPKEQSTEARLWALVEEQRKDMQTLLELLKDRDREIKTLRAELESLKKGAA